MKKYWKYLLYVLEHKKNVGIECLKDGLFIHAITHDLSKFLPSEFFPYAEFFYGSGEKSGFHKAWLLHQHRNKHHWDYWVNSKQVPTPVPKKYIKQMICDWKGMSRKFGDTPQEYYQNNKDKMILHKDTKKEIKRRLGI
jgi:hypothetical protein